VIEDKSRAVVHEHQATGADRPSPGAGYALRMSDEIHDWLTDLRGSNESTALRVMRALATLMREGASLGAPVVLAPADSWPWALAEALDRAYQENLDRLTALRRGEADAAALVNDIQDHVAELETVRAKLEQVHAVADLAAVQQQLAEAQRLLPGMIEARRRLREQNQHLQARTDAARARKETLKASHAAARASLHAREAMAALGLADDDSDRQPEASGEAAGAAEARLAEVTAQMERELGQEGGAEGLRELWPGAPWHEDIRILFAVEPAGTALLIAVLDGPEAVQDQYPEAVMVAADVLRQVRAGQAPEAAARAYERPRSFLEEFYPGVVGDLGGGSSSQ
jgi:hypothetical protein